MSVTNIKAAESHPQRTQTLSNHRLRAEIVRVTHNAADIKIIDGDDMHVMSWRRTLFWDEVLVDGVRQQASRGLWGRETVYGLVFGRDEEGQGGHRVMLTLDPQIHYDWSGENPNGNIRGVRLDAAEGAIAAFGSLDPKNNLKPASWNDWAKKMMGVDFDSK